MTYKVLCPRHKRVYKAKWKSSNLLSCAIGQMGIKFLLYNFTLEQKQTSPRLWVLTLSPCLFPASLVLISRHRLLASDAADRGTWK